MKCAGPEEAKFEWSGQDYVRIICVKCVQSAQFLGGSGGMPPRKFVNFRRSQIDSDAFWDTLFMDRQTNRQVTIKNELIK